MVASSRSLLNQATHSSVDSLPGELARSFPEPAQARERKDALFLLPTEAALARWLRRTATLSEVLTD